VHQRLESNIVLRLKCDIVTHVRIKMTTEPTCCEFSCVSAQIAGILMMFCQHNATHCKALYHTATHCNIGAQVADVLMMFLHVSHVKRMNELCHTCE